MEELNASAREYLGTLADRPAAQSPATLSDIWAAEWTRSGLDVPAGAGKPFEDARSDLVAAIEGATGKQLGVYAREKGVRLTGTVDRQIAALGSLVDTLDEGQAKSIEPLRDVRKRAAEKAQKIERDAADVSDAAYGLSGVATSWLAGIARQTADPVVLGANVLTAPIGGPFKGPLLPMLARQGASGLVAQGVVEPSIQAGRAELGLESGAGRAAVDTLEAGAGSVGLAALFRGTAATFRFARGRGRPELAPSAPGEISPPSTPAAGARTGESPAGIATAPAQRTAAAAEASLEATRRSVIADALSRMEDDGKVLRRRADLAPEDFAAAARVAERDQVLDAAALAEAGGLRRRPRDLALAETVAAGIETGRLPAEGTVGLIRPNGGRLSVRPMLVELEDLIASHDLDGRPNPAYPAELQPRDRSAAASRTWVMEKAATLEPELLGDAPTAGLGAPVIGPDGVVESGNGRVLLLQQAYQSHPDRVGAYRDFLERQGYDTTEFRQPVLVRERIGNLPMTERAALALEANVSPTAGLSTRERAFADAGKLDQSMLAAYVPGDVHAAGNASFVRTFAELAVAPEERPQFFGADNRLSAEGARRIEAALVARAWGAEDIVRALYESAEPTSKAILGAFADTAPQVARLRAAVTEGRLAATADPTPALLDGFRLVEHARATGNKVGDLVNQIDIERGAVPDATREAVRLYFRDDDLRIAAGRAGVAERIDKAVARALDQQNAVGDLFGAEFKPADSLRAAKLAGVEVSDLPMRPKLPEGVTQHGTAYRLPIRNREGDDVGRVQFAIDSFDISRKKKTIQVEGVQIDNEANRGKGYGIAAYQKLVDFALESGREFWSDLSVSPAAARMYDALQRRGYNVVKDADPGFDGAAFKVTGRPDQKKFLKEVVDQRPVPEALPEKHDLYFNVEKATKTVEISDLVSTKTAAENAQGAENGAKRMAAAAAGEIGRRDPITVTPLPDGKYLVLDGNGTMSSVARYDWKSLPVKVEPGLFGDAKAGAIPKDVKSETFAGKRLALLEGQPFKTLDQAIAAAPAHQKELIGLIAEAAHGRGTVKDPGPKANRTRMEQKIAEKYNGNPRRLTDLNRAGITVETPAQAEAIIAAIGEKARVIDEGWKVDQVGYFDRKLDVILADGTVAEVQFWPVEVSAAKSQGEKMYQARRVLAPADQPAAMSREVDYWREVASRLDAKWSEVIGGSPNVSKVSDQPLRASSSERGNPSRPTSAGLTERQPPSSAAKAAEPDMTASVSSQENQRMDTSPHNIGPGEADGNPALAKEAERALGDAGGDFELSIVDKDGSVRKVSARQALAELDEDAAASAELSDCIGMELAA